ncbi:MAG TPA: amidase [Terracidiphilus sp.]|jgi:Asp-tRNA(Asn)/Glu-tRNA(Gln) amidotransferase A subunit family amidase
MTQTRRDFLATSALGALGAAFPLDAQTPAPSQNQQTPGAPPAFGTAQPVGPEVGAETFGEAEKLVQIEMSAADRAQAAGNWREAMAPLYERRTGPRKMTLEPSLPPATVWNPMLPGVNPGKSGRGENYYIRSADPQKTVPANETDVAFASVAQLSRWIQSRQITSERLTNIYLDRLQKFDPKLRCVITLTKEHALEQARQADKEIAAGKYRGPLHGIPWGAKDLLDTAGIPTTYGAEPYRERVPKKDSAVVDRLNTAGAVLVAKLSLGALALNDIWFGGQTMNPWLLEEGASGSSAGPGAATAAGLVGFSIGSETGGSIVSPSMRCGVTGLRPTYGRVARTGAMTLCWSLDKLGPMARYVEDTILVLTAISGPDAGDLASVPSALAFDANAKVTGLRVGYFPAWMKEAPATDVDRASLDVVRRLGMKLVEVSLPDWPYDSLNLILFAESAAAFEELTLSHKEAELRAQVSDGWPNTFRQSRFLSAVDFVQADRMRRKVAQEMARVMSEVDLLLVPSLRDEILVITNNTGHPSLTFRAGFVEVSEARSDWAPDPKHPLPKFSPPRRVPHGITLIGRLFDEGTLCEAGIAMERAFGVAGERPPGF